MRKSLVSFIVLFVVCSLFLTVIPVAHSQTTPTNVKIVSYSWYIDSLGILDVVGEVQNVGTSTVSSVILAGTASSSDGAQVQSSTQVYVTDLIPNQKAPFYWEFYDQSNQNGGTWNHPDVSNLDLFVYQAETTNNYQYSDLKITNDHSSIGTNPGISSTDQTADLGVYWVNGQIQNIGSQTATNVRVIGTFYNSSGAVVAVGGYVNEVVSASLAPSASSSFKFGAFDLNQTGIVSDKKITSYSLLIQVDSPILQGTAPSLPPPTVTPTQGTNPTDTTAPENTSPNSNPVGDQSTNWIYGAVAVIIIALIIAGVLGLRSRSKPKTEAKTSGKSKPKTIKK
jgi:hypothetical protein